MWFRKKRTPVEPPQPGPAHTARDFPIPIYLNQRLVFDLLAIIEDGFAGLRRVRTSSLDEQVDSTEARASLGTGNPFAFVGVQLGTDAKRGTKYNEEVTADRVHTPTSRPAITCSSMESFTRYPVPMSSCG